MVNSELSNLSLTSEERSWLKKACPFFAQSYLDFLAALRLDPATQVEATFVPSGGSEDEMGDIEILIKGKWAETILYEVSLSVVGPFRSRMTLSDDASTLPDLTHQGPSDGHPF